MNENELQDLDVSTEDAENISGGYSVKPVTPIVPGVESTASGVVKTVIKEVTPVSGGPSY